jgi:hypothetical protein
VGKHDVFISSYRFFADDQVKFRPIYFDIVIKDTLKLKNSLQISSILIILDVNTHQ